MADDDPTKISEVEKQKILDWLNKRWVGSRACIICGTNQWTLSDHIVAPTTISKGNMSLGGAAYPQAMVICNNCGHTHYFNAVMIGVAETKKPEEKSNG